MAAHSRTGTCGVNVSLTFRSVRTISSQNDRVPVLFATARRTVAGAPSRTAVSNQSTHSTASNSNEWPSSGNSISLASAA